MALSIGIIGLPNVGKSTVFNALTRTQNAQVANYPFCTIEPNKAIVPVPDKRTEKLTELAGVGRTIQATIEFVDIAGLVRGASKGEGLGNQFLGHIRDTHALIHVVRCFDDPNVIHVSDGLDPRADAEIVLTELMLADLQQLERKIEKLERQIKGDRKVQPLLDMAQALQDHLARGQTLAAFGRQEESAFRALNQEMRFLTAKPVIYAANVNEDDLGGGSEVVRTIREMAAEQGAEAATLCARLEEEMAGLTDEERQEFLELSGIATGGLEQIIQRSYRLLDLISFFTMNNKEVRAWTVAEGTAAPQAAGVIHTDFERGFIRAEVIPYETFVKYGGSAAVKAAGAMRVEGKEYIVQDGDVIYFRFNV